MKLDNINNEEGRHYLQTWIKGLNVMLGWPEARTLKWSEKWAKGLNGSGTLFFHETPGWYILTLLIPQALRNGLSGAELATLKQSLLGVIEQNDSFCYRRPGFDWHSTKQRVEVFIAKAEDQKKTSKEALKTFLVNYQKQKLIKGPSKHVKKLLRKTYR